MFEARLQQILRELKKHKTSSEDIFPMFVQQRLNKSLLVYYKNLVESSTAIKNRADTVNVAKKLLKDI